MNYYKVWVNYYNQDCRDVSEDIKVFAPSLEKAVDRLSDPSDEASQMLPKTFEIDKSATIESNDELITQEDKLFLERCLIAY